MRKREKTVMKNLFFVILAAIFLLSCGNKLRQTEPVIYDDKPIVEHAEHDTLLSPIPEDSPKTEEKPSLSASSSSSLGSHKSRGYDNMHGFDPASEDDMDDNGMSRYMENNDEEGWD